jgi:2-oxoglutarate dehydrogenase E1 component
MNICIFLILQKENGLEIELKKLMILNLLKMVKKQFLNKLIQAEGFEKFLHTKYVGTKRFGLDGGESLIPALEQIIKIGGQSKVKEVKIGMSHRGRLNVLANVLQKSYKRIFNEFAGEISSSKEDECWRC